MPLEGCSAAEFSKTGIVTGLKYWQIPGMALPGSSCMPSPDKNISVYLTLHFWGIYQGNDLVAIFLENCPY
jgi:hypothetical protein